MNAILKLKHAHLNVGRGDICSSKLVALISLEVSRANLSHQQLPHIPYVMHALGVAVFLAARAGVSGAGYNTSYPVYLAVCS